MKQFGTLFKHYFLNNIRSAAFIAVTAILLVVMGVGLNWSHIAALFAGDEDAPVAPNYVIQDDTGYDLLSLPDWQITDAGAQTAPMVNRNVPVPAEAPTEFVDVQTALGTPAPSTEAIDRYLQEEKAVAYITLTIGPDRTLQAEIRSERTLSLPEQSGLSEALRQLNRKLLIRDSGIPGETVERILQTVPTLTSVVLNPDSGRTPEQKTAGMIVAYIISFVIFFIVLLYSSMIMMQISQEKTSRVMEILITSVTPSAHLFSRLTAVLCTALLQLLLLAGGALLFGTLGGSLKQLGDLQIDLTPEYGLIILLLLFGNLSFYMLLSALLGSLVNRPEDASQAQAPFSLLLVMGFYVNLFGMMVPDSLLLKIFSYLPFSSSMCMTMRLGVSDTPLLQGWVAVLISLLSSALMGVLTVKIYHGSVLSYRVGSLKSKLKAAWSLKK